MSDTQVQDPPPFKESKAEPNYVVNVAAFGAYKRGDVIPSFAVKAASHKGDVNDHIAAGHVSATDQPITVTVVAPRARQDERDAVASKDVMTTLNTTREQANRFEKESQHYRARFESANQQVTALSTELTQKVSQLDGYRLEIADVRTQLAAAVTARQDAEKTTDGAGKVAREARDELEKAKAEIAKLQVELSQAQKTGVSPPTITTDDSGGVPAPVTADESGTVPPPVTNPPAPTPKRGR